MALNARQEKRLLNSVLFSGCNTANYRPLIQSLSPVRVLKGQTVTSYPRQTPSLGFLIDGCLDVYNPSGVLFFTLQSGDFFELESLFSHIKPILPLKLRARSNSIITFLDKSVLLPVFENDAAAARNYMEILSNRVQHLTRRLNHFTAATPSVALALYLLGNHRQNHLRLPDGLAGLARRLDISRATLYRALAELEQQQLVTHQEKTVHILNRSGLQHYAATRSQASAENIGK